MPPDPLQRAIAWLMHELVWHVRSVFCKALDRKAVSAPPARRGGPRARLPQPPASPGAVPPGKQKCGGAASAGAAECLSLALRCQAILRCNN